MVSLQGLSGKSNINNAYLGLLLRIPRLSLAQVFQRPRKTTYYSEDGYKIVIEDPRRSFTRADHCELARYLDQELLRKDHDITCLSKIIIDDYGENRIDGTWTFLARKDRGVYSGRITLNHTYLKTLDDLKETLAHEYGHHWSIVHCIRSHWPEFENNRKIRSHRLPNEYYELRGLDSRAYYPGYQGEWYQCDKEVIAEDYRILFAPHPYNQDHAVIEAIQEEGMTQYVIHHPSEEIRKYIYELGFMF